MLKQMLMIGAAAVSFPALAQEQPMETPTPPTPEQAEPLPAPAPEADVPPADSAAPPAEPAPSGNAATPAQIAQIVDQEFPTYDGDASGELNETEFAAWMKKLRAATDPAVDVESEEVKGWISQAWTVADADGSGGISKEELTAFLSRGA